MMFVHIPTLEMITLYTLFEEESQGLSDLFTYIPAELGFAFTFLVWFVF